MQRIDGKSLFSLAMVLILLGGVAGHLTVELLKASKAGLLRPASGATIMKAGRDKVQHVISARRAEIRMRFNQAVAMLGMREYDHAATALHRVLELDPTMVEAHVNMGFAMIGQERFSLARDFFTGAIGLRPGQANAHYGLALALAGLGDLDGAQGSMRHYLSLEPGNGPYRAKAEEWLSRWQKIKGQQ